MPGTGDPGSDIPEKAAFHAAFFLQLVVFVFFDSVLFVSLAFAMMFVALRMPASAQHSGL